MPTPSQFFTGSSTIATLIGGVSIIKDVQSGQSGTLAVAGTATINGIVNASGGLAVTGSLTGVSLTAVSSLTASTGISVTAGGITVTAGGITISSGGETITLGGLAVTGGTITDTFGGGEGTVQTFSGGVGTVTVGTRVIKVSGTGGTLLSSVTIPVASIPSGAELIVINENATVGSTIVINTGVILKAGTTAVTVSGLAAARFIFDHTQSLWVNV